MRKSKKWEKHIFLHPQRRSTENLKQIGPIVSSQFTLKVNSRLAENNNKIIIKKIRCLRYFLSYRFLFTSISISRDTMRVPHVSGQKSSPRTHFASQRFRRDSSRHTHLIFTSISFSLSLIFLLFLFYFLFPFSLFYFLFFIYFFSLFFSFSFDKLKFNSIFIS